MDKIDYKKTEKHLYLPKAPAIVQVPEMAFFAVDGAGDPNTSPAYQQAMEILYGLSFTVKMSRMSGEEPAGYFDYVVPPLEGFWRQEGGSGIDYGNKDGFRWTSAIRLPDFVTPADFAWAVETASRKKKLDCSAAEFWTVEEGLCVQIMHLGSFDSEPESVAKMDAFIEEQGYAGDLSEARRHHEIYLTDARRVPPERWKTVIRHPIRKV